MQMLPDELSHKNGSGGIVWTTRVRCCVIHVVANYLNDHYVTTKEINICYALFHIVCFYTEKVLLSVASKVGR